MSTRVPMNVAQGLRIQRAHLNQLAQVLRPEVMRHVEEVIAEANKSLHEDSTGYDVVRGGSIDEIVMNHAGRMHHDSLIARIAADRHNLKHVHSFVWDGLHFIAIYSGGSTFSAIYCEEGSMLDHFEPEERQAILQAARSRCFC